MFQKSRSVLHSPLTRAKLIKSSQYLNKEITHSEVKRRWNGGIKLTAGFLRWVTASEFGLHCKDLEADMVCRLHVEKPTFKSTWVYRALQLAWLAHRLAWISLGCLQVVFVLGFTYRPRSISKPPILPPSVQTPGHLTFLKNFGQIPCYVASLDGQMPYPLELSRGSNPPPCWHVKATVQNLFPA